MREGRELRSRASSVLAVVGLVALGLPAVAASKELPAVKIAKFAVKAVPIGTLPRTGNVLGAGAALEIEYEFAGSGYGATAANPKGRIPPLSALNFYVPYGTQLDRMAFNTCTQEMLEQVGAGGCPKGSAAGPIGSALSEVAFGAARVDEKTTLQSFFAPAGDLLLLLEGAAPVPLKVVSSADFVRAPWPYGEELKALVPPVNPVPNATRASARLVSIKRIKVKMEGALRRVHPPMGLGTMVYFIHLPHVCHKGLPFKTEVTFGGPGFGSPAKVATARYEAPCPTLYLKKKKKKRA